MRVEPAREDALVDTRDVDDVDAIALQIGDGLNTEYVQLEPKPFRVRWTRVHQRSLVSQFGSGEIAVLRRVRVPADRWAFMIPIQLADGARWNGHAVGSDEIIVCPPRSECLAFDPSFTEFAILTVGCTSPAAEAALPLVAGRPQDPVAVACGVGAPKLPGRLRRLRNRIEAGLPLASVDSSSSLTRLLADRLRGVASRRSDVPSLASRSEIVGRAEAFFRCHVSEGVSVGKLSSVAGVSERSLRNAFYDVYTTSPKRYMLLWQLHQVRHALRAGLEAATVTEVATGHGFYELGRFAGAYKTLFGEAPSETLSKARQGVAAIRGVA